MLPRRASLAITSLLFSGTFLAGTFLASAESCIPLKVIGGQGTRVKKSVSLPGLLVTRNNYNTDFAVPGSVAFRKFTATIEPQDNADYNISVNLKYSDKSTEEVYNNTSVQLSKGQPLIISGSPHSNNQPYQVNIKVSGLEKVGHTYIVSVVGCS